MENIIPKCFPKPLSFAVIESASSQELLHLGWSEIAFVLSDVEFTSDGRSIRHLLGDTTKFILTGKIESDETRSAALDDYRKFMGEYGSRFRDFLRVERDLSAWWLLNFTEKAVGSTPVGLFRILKSLELISKFIRNRDGERLKQLHWIGSSPGAEVVRSWAKAREPRLAIFQYPLQESKKQGPKKESSKKKLAWLFDVRYFTRPRKAKIVLVSDFPDSWDAALRPSRDRYLGDMIPWLIENFGDHYKCGLFQRSTPLTLVASPDKALEVIDHWGRPWDLLRAKLWSRSVISRLNYQTPEFFKKEYCGADFGNYFKNLIVGELEKSIPNKLYSIWALSRYLKLSGTRKVLFRNDFYINGRMISWACLRTGISCVSFQHGAYGSKHGVYSFDRKELEGRLAIPIPSLMAVWGEWFRNLLIDQYDYPAHKILSWGSQRLLCRVDDFKNKRAKPKIKNVQTRRVLFALQDESAPLEIIFLALEKMKDAPTLVIKTHPQSNMLNELRYLQERFPTVRTSMESTFLWDLMQTCDALITGYSTAGLEAILIGLPVFYIQLPESRGHIPFADFNERAYPIKQPDDFIAGWSSILTNASNSHPISEQLQGSLIYFYNCLNNWLRETEN